MYFKSLLVAVVLVQLASAKVVPRAAQDNVVALQNQLNVIGSEIAKALGIPEIDNKEIAKKVQDLTNKLAGDANSLLQKAHADFKGSQLPKTLEQLQKRTEQAVEKIRKENPEASQAAEKLAENLKSFGKGITEAVEASRKDIQNSELANNLDKYGKDALKKLEEFGKQLDEQVKKALAEGKKA